MRLNLGSAALAWIRRNRGLIVFLICIGFFRTVIADWNPIPSGSMRPTLLEGDLVLVNRLAYDLKVPLTDVSVLPLGDPDRGDIVTFFSPETGTRLIKRIVGLPGDEITIVQGKLMINDLPAIYDQAIATTEPVNRHREVPAIQVMEALVGSRHSVQYFPRSPSARRFGPVSVPEDHYFMMGDSRDNSRDSRFFGPVHRDLLVGRAHRVIASLAYQENWLPRINRFGLALE